ncbi:hypothetical protein SDC9_180405 [bioreactor metagenome]|uniref:Outer membrane efflux protein n=1 Tax=bioreactor metagenome TaxID=1076179 RepID=A0A645H3M6_9ZZZZ
MNSLKNAITARTYGVAAYNNYDIYIAQRAYDLADEAEDSGVIVTDRKEGYALENTRAKHRAAFDSMRADAILKLDLLSAAMDTYQSKEKVFSIASKKYELGMISQNEFEDAKDQLSIDYAAVVDAQIAFSKVYESFKIFVDKGVWLSTNS